MRQEVRARMDLIRRQRALARMGVRASGCESFENYRAVGHYGRTSGLRAANDNPRPPRRLRRHWPAAVSLLSILVVAAILIWGR